MMESKGRETRMTMKRMTKRGRARAGKARTREDKRAWAGADGGGRGRSQGEGAESKPGLCCNEFPLYFVFFIFMGASGWGPHQPATAGRR
jgi:hypothetical protein